MKDLLVVVADKNMKFAIEGLLIKNEAFNIREVDFEVIAFADKCDTGMFQHSIAFLREINALSRYHYVILMFDWEGCGQEHKMSLDKAQALIQEMLDQNGWKNKSSVIILNPELEIWCWAQSNKMAEIIKWPDYKSITKYLIEKEYLSEGETKPGRPKEAFEELLKEKSKPRSSAIYKDLASYVSFKKCEDQAFLTFKEVLRNWFPTSN